MHQFDAAAFDLNAPRLSGEGSTCELSALLPGLRTEMFHGNRRRLIDVVARKEHAYGNVAIVTLSPQPSCSTPLAEAQTLSVARRTSTSSQATPLSRGLSLARDLSFGTV